MIASCILMQLRSPCVGCMLPNDYKGNLILPMCSGEVGLGLNVRRLLEDFQGPFTVAYSLRPIGDVGTVFRRYPGKWKVGRPAIT